MWLNNLLLFCATTIVTIFCISINAHNSRWAKRWKWGVADDIPGERFLKVYFLHLLNPDEFLAGKVPVVKDKGPYTYRQHKFKVGVKNNGNSIEYNETELYYFEREMSIGSQQDLVNTINIPLITLIDLVAFTNPIFAPLIADYLKNFGEELVATNLTVQDILFEGIDVSTFFTNGIIQNFLPDDFEDEHFGIFKGINGSDNGIFEVSAAKDNFGQIISWDKKSDLGIWENNSLCDQIQGTDGSVFISDIKLSSKLRVFDVSACRSFPLVYSETVEFKGIQGYRFVYPVDMLQEPSQKPENQCYCKYVNEKDCEKSGTTDLSLCRNGPYFLTFPHFMDADPSYLEKVNGLNPNSEELYATYFDIEPHTGVVLKSNKRFQLNLKLRPLDNIPTFSTLQEMLFPIFWTDESYQIDDRSAYELRGFLQNEVNSPLATENVSERSKIAPTSQKPKMSTPATKRMKTTSTTQVPKSPNGIHDISTQKQKITTATTPKPKVPLATTSKPKITTVSSRLRRVSSTTTENVPSTNASSTITPTITTTTTSVPPVSNTSTTETPPISTESTQNPKVNKSSISTHTQSPQVSSTALQVSEALSVLSHIPKFSSRFAQSYSKRNSSSVVSSSSQQISNDSSVASAQLSSNNIYPTHRMSKNEKSMNDLQEVASNKSSDPGTATPRSMMAFTNETMTATITQDDYTWEDQEITNYRTSTAEKVKGIIPTVLLHIFALFVLCAEFT